MVIEVFVLRDTLTSDEIVVSNRERWVKLCLCCRTGVAGRWDRGCRVGSVAGRSVGGILSSAAQFIWQKNSCLTQGILADYGASTNSDGVESYWLLSLKAALGNKKNNILRN